jgi:hypothetical protein
MASRSRAAGVVLATLLGSFLVVLVLGWLLGTSATSAEPTPGPTPTPTPTATGPGPFQLVVGANRLAVDGDKVELFQGVRVWARTAAGTTQLCLTKPAGGWTPTGKDWQVSQVDGAQAACRPIERAVLARPITIELSNP